MKKGTFIDFAVIMAARSHRKNKNLAVTEQKSKRRWKSAIPFRV